MQKHEYILRFFFRVAFCFIIVVPVLSLAANYVDVPTAEGETANGAYVTCPVQSHQCGGVRFNQLYGKWQGLDKAAESLFGILEISGDTLTWGGGRIPICKTPYVVDRIYAGGSYPDQAPWFKNRHNGLTYTAFLLKIVDPVCAKTAGMLQISVTENLDTAEIVTYNNRQPHHVDGRMLMIRLD